MKRIFLLIPAVLLTVLFSGCGGASSVKETQSSTAQTSAETTLSETTYEPAPETTAEQTGTVISSEHILGTQLALTGGYYEWAGSNFIILVSSAEELREYYDFFNGIYYLGSVDRYEGDPKIGWIDAVAKYDDMYFTNNVLLMLTFFTGSGGHRYDITGIEYIDGKAYFVVERIIEYGGDDIAQWHILVELDTQVRLDGYKRVETDRYYDRPFFTVHEAIDRFNAFITDKATLSLAERRVASPYSIDNPTLERINCGIMYAESPYYFTGRYDTSSEKSLIFKVTFPEKDGVGHISYYVTPDGRAIADDKG